MTDKQKTLQIEIHLIIDRLQNGLIHPSTAKNLLYESANKALSIGDVSKFKAMTQAERQQIENTFFRKERLYYIRIRDGYRFSGEEVDLAMNHYFKTGNKP